MTVQCRIGHSWLALYIAFLCCVLEIVWNFLGSRCLVGAPCSRRHTLECLPCRLGCAAMLLVTWLSLSSPSWLICSLEGSIPWGRGIGSIMQTMLVWWEMDHNVSHVKNVSIYIAMNDGDEFNFIFIQGFGSQDLLSSNIKILYFWNVNDGLPTRC